TETENDWQTIKQKAGIALEKAQVLAQQGKLGAQQTALLLKAQEAFRENSFVQVLLFTKEMDGTSGTSTTGLFDFVTRIPLSLIPVFIAIGVIGFLRFRKKEQKETEKPKIKVERVSNNL
ncbi:hypothetical protein KKE06_02600, partial [Candidatus Micrarchaeota archaeon]|nr:hypothetical protein [Candidatus Micrarchaeota archaeon]